MITLRGFYTFAKGRGYKGSETDPEAMKAFLLALPEVNENDESNHLVGDGTAEYEVKSLVFPEAPKKKKSVATILTDEQPIDFSDKVTAAVNERFKQMGWDPAAGRRPGHPTEIGTHQKSPEERMYEDKIKRGNAVFSSFELANAFGSDLLIKALRATGRGDEAQEMYKKQAERLSQKGYTLVSTAAGSALSPESFDPDLHHLINSFGVARQAARVVAMSSETISRPKATGNLTVYYPQDGSAGTESTKTWSNVQMRAKMGVVIVKASRALTQDSAIGIADDAAKDIVRAFAYVEDNSLFSSNGSGATNNYIPQTSGILFQIGAGGASASTAFVQTAETSTNSRVFKSTATTPGAITIGDITSLMATPGNFVGKMNMFHCTRQVGHAIFHRLAASVGGIQPVQIQGLGLVPTFLGVPILYNNVMSTGLGTGSNRQLVVYGDLSLAADFGDRMGLSVEISEQRYWDENNIGIKGVARHDINVHALGATATAGPVAVLTQS